MGDVKKNEFFCLENFKALNGENYRREDIRTYTMPPLGPDPYADILAHLSVPDLPSNGRTLVRTSQGNFSGNLYSETFEKAKNLILHFPKASTIKTPKGVILVDRKKLPALLPSWMITRYGRENLPERMSLDHPVSLYLDKRTKQFLYFFDESFLAELDPKLLTEGVDKQVFRIYQDAQRQPFLALASKEFNDFDTIGNSFKQDNPIAQAWSQIQENYVQRTLDSRDLEKVIVINCRRDHLPNLDKESTGADLFNSSMQMTYGIAARHDKSYYWMDKNGEINTRVSGSVHRGHGDSALGLLRGGAFALDQTTTVVIPYTDEDWNKLGIIKARLDAIQDSLWALISGCQADRGSKIDNSLNESLQKLGSTKLLGLESQ